MRIETDSIGSRIRKRRLEMGMSQTQLAKGAGITSASMCDIEKGKTQVPAGLTLVKIAGMLEVNPDWILTGKGEMLLEKIETGEKPMLESIRKLDDNNKKAVAAMIQALIAQQK